MFDDPLDEPLPPKRQNLQKLDEVFISQEHFDSVLKENREKYWSKEEYNKGFGARKLYTQLNYKLGILDKIELYRSKSAPEAIEKISELLFTLGFEDKQICYWIWRLGIPGLNFGSFGHLLARKRSLWKINKFKFMDELQKVRDQVFQNLKKEVMDVEERNLKILLVKLEKLNTALDETDPIEFPTKFNRLLKQITTIEDKLQGAHGLKELRAGFVKATTEIAIHKGKMEAENPQALPGLRDVSDGPELME